MATDFINPIVAMAYYDYLVKQELARQESIVLARAYHNGVQPVYLTDRQKEFLDLHTDNQFCLNVTATVVNSVAGELNVIGFDSDETENAEGVKEVAAWFWDSVWKINKMDEQQGNIHEAALRDSETFIVLEWDDSKKAPLMVHHERYTSDQVNAWEGSWSDLTNASRAQLTGTGEGVFAIYENDDPNQEMTAAVKEWYQREMDENGRLTSYKRRTVYKPDVIERYRLSPAGKWEEYEPPQPWIDSAGNPIGIPVIHFKNKNLKPEAWDAIPLQDGINKTYVDILGAMDLSGFPFFVILGMYPTNDGKAPNSDNTNVWSVGPAQFLGNANAKEGASVQKFEGTDPTPLMETLKDQILIVANITDTPASRFVVTSQIASADTLKEQERGLRKKASNRMILFGNAWERVADMARKINNVFGVDQYPEDVTITVIWANIDSLDDLQKELALGVPLDTLWRKIGYSDWEIAEMKRGFSYRAQMLKTFWESYNAALTAGSAQTPEDFARLLGMSKDEIKLISGTDRIPPQGL